MSAVCPTCRSPIDSSSVEGLCPACLFTGLLETQDDPAASGATSSDLATWTVDDANSPVLDVGAVGTWDDSWIGDPSLYPVGGTWWMAYYGFDGSHARDGLATASSFPTDWTKYGGNPVLDIGAGGSFDATHAHKPYIFQTDAGMWHYYTAEGPAQREIAVAEATA